MNEFDKWFVESALDFPEYYSQFKNMMEAAWNKAKEMGQRQGAVETYEELIELMNRHKNSTIG